MHVALGADDLGESSHDHGFSFPTLVRAAIRAARRRAGSGQDLVEAAASRSSPSSRSSVDDGDRRHELHDLAVRAGGLDQHVAARRPVGRPSRRGRRTRTSMPRTRRVPRTCASSSGCEVSDLLEGGRACARPGPRCRGAACRRSTGRSAAVAVTKAGLLPRKVPLCSPGDQMSSSGLMQGQGHRQAVAADRLRDADDVRADAGVGSKLKNSPVRPQPIWMSSTMRSMSWRRHSSSSDRSHSACGDVHAALALDRLDDHRGRVVRGPLPLSVSNRSNHMKSGMLRRPGSCRRASAWRGPAGRRRRRASSSCPSPTASRGSCRGRRW